MLDSVECEGSYITPISGLSAERKKALAAASPKPCGIEMAAVALPLRTASRAAASVAGLTSSALSEVRRATISREIALPSASTASTGIRVISVCPPLPPKM